VSYPFRNNDTPRPWSLALFWALFVAFAYYVVGGYIPFLDNAAPGSTIIRTVSSGKYVEVATKDLILCIIAAIVVGANLSASFKRAKKALFIVLLSLLSFASTLWSVTPIRSTFSLMLLVEIALIYGLMSRLSFDDIRRWLLHYTFGLVLACFGVVLFYPACGIGPGGAWRCIFCQKNICAQNLLVLLPFALSNRPPRFSFGWLEKMLCSFGISFIVLMSQSRLGWIAALLYFPIHLVLNAGRRFREKHLLFLTFGAALISMIVVGVVEMERVLAILNKDPSFNGRTVIWLGSIAAILKHPWLGYGYEAFWRTNDSGEASNIIIQSNWGVVSAHNGFLEVVLGMGIVGGALLVAAFANSAWNAWSALKGPYDLDQQLCVEVLVIVFLAGLTEVPWNSSVEVVWFMYILADGGLRVSLERRNLMGEKSRRRKGILTENNYDDFLRTNVRDQGQFSRA
jgi:exopolysaccharide production protein ExoQ